MQGADGTLSSSSSELAEAVADAILAQYHSLPNTGKPQPNEHTVLAGFAISLDGIAGTSRERARTRAADEAAIGQHLSGAGDYRQGLRVVPVALGTGTKCVGSRQSSHQIGVINDSHAEVSPCCSRRWQSNIVNIVSCSTSESCQYGNVHSPEGTD